MTPKRLPDLDRRFFYNLSNNADRFHTFIRCTSGPRTGQYVLDNLDCDGTSREIEVAVENNLITEIKFLD